MKLSPRYIAGFVDADGSISISRFNKPGSIHVRYQIRLTASNCDRRPLDAICAQFGGGVYTVQKRTARHREAFSWIAVSKDAVKALKAIHPHLIVKKRQAELVFELQANIDKYKHTLGSGHWLHPDRAKIMAQRQALADEVARLKRV